MIISPEINEKVNSLLAQNRKIEAIKVIYNHANCGLKEAKDYVDGLVLPTEEIDLPKKNIDEALLELLYKGKKLEAIKMYKDATKLGLKESKDYVEHLYSQSDPTHKTPNSRETDIQNITRHTYSQSSAGSPSKSFLIKLGIVILFVFALIYLMFKI